ncbi:MAG: GtrA family protein [Acidimicrobiia bacterium]
MIKYIRSLLTPTAISQLVKVGIIGVANTVVSFALLNVFLSLLGGTKTVDEGFNWEQFWAIALSFLIATELSYVLNRRWAFDLTKAGDKARETAHFVGINVVAWAVTQAVVGGADWIWGPLTRIQQNFFYLLASLVIIVPKFAGYRDIVFRKAIDSQASPAEAAQPDPDGVAPHLP